jgi:hypothetical protein
MCAAPKGNQFWKLRSKHGRDRLFETAEMLWEAACEYFNWCDAHPWFKVEQLKKPYLDKGKDGAPDKWITVTKVPTARPYTMQGLCLYLDCNLVYFNQFEKSLEKKEDELSKDFSKIVSRIRETIYMQKFEGAAVGAFNSNLIARELGLTDKTELTGKDGGPIQTEQITGMEIK